MLGRRIIIPKLEWSSKQGEQTNKNIFSDFFFSFDENDFNICKVILSFHSFKSVVFFL